MQYFSALQKGRIHVNAAREYLNKFTHGRAMPAMALKDRQDGVWEPVGEEKLFAIVDETTGYVLTESHGCIVAIVDSTGMSKAIVQGVNDQERKDLIKKFEADNLKKYNGKVVLPV